MKALIGAMILGCALLATGCASYGGKHGGCKCSGCHGEQHKHEGEKHKCEGCKDGSCPMEGHKHD